MSFGSWLTGRESKNDIKIDNIDQAKEVIQNLQKMASANGCVSLLGQDVENAVAKLNSATGMDYLGGININSSAFDQVGAQVTQLSSMMQQRVEDAEYYSKSFWERAASTFCMVGAKIGEGFLSAFEDIGDGVASVVGWIAPKDSGVEKWCENFIKKDWSHDAFSFYYDSEFAKSSAITESSALASACEIGGKAAGYLYAGGMISSLGKGFSSVKVVGKLGQYGLKIASSSTWSATIAAGLGGMGSGTETGLYQGKTLDEAASSNGVKTAVISAGLAFAGGKAHEIRAARSAGARGLDAIKQSPTHQGYEDAFTKAGQDFGSALRSNPIKGLITANPVSQLVKSTFTPGVSSASTALGKVGQVAKNTVTAVPRAIATTAKTAVTFGGIAATANAAIDQVGTHGTSEEQFRQFGHAIDPNEEVGPLVLQENPTKTVQQPQAGQNQQAPDSPPTEEQKPDDKSKNENPTGTGPTGTGPTSTTPTATDTLVSTEPEPTTAVEQPVTDTPVEIVQTPVDTGPSSSSAATTLQHTGGEYSGETGFTGEAELADLVDETGLTTSIDDIIKGNKYSKVPTSSSPIGKAVSTSTGSSIIPISAGLSAAAAVGLGAKAYLNKKEKDEEVEDIGESWTNDKFEVAEEIPEEEETLADENSTLQSRIIESITGEDYAE